MCPPQSCFVPQQPPLQIEMYLADCAVSGICLIRCPRIRPKSRGFLEASEMPCKLCRRRFPTPRKSLATTPQTLSGWRFGRRPPPCGGDRVADPSSRIAEPGSDPFNNQRPFKLAHGSDHLEHQTTGRCAEVEVVPQGDKCHPIRIQISE